MNNPWRIFTGRATRFALLASAFLVVASCGSSNVPSVSSGPAPVVGPVAILPATATVYSETPTTFQVTGGSGTFIVASSDQRVLPLNDTFSGTGFTVVPNAVSVDTPVTLTVRDAAGPTQATAQLTVKPRTVSSTITVTPSAGQSAACGTAICAGGDAEVVATLSQGGAPLRGAQTRFEVLSGDFRIVTSGPGVTPEVLATSVVTTTDSNGTARVRIRALPEAGSQVALIQITDLGSGSFTRTGFSIAPASNTPLNAQPNSINFAGRDSTACASNVSAEVFVFGGRPPYTISQPPSFSVQPTVVTSSGGRFVVTATGQCSSGTQIAVVDAAGASATVTATNVPGPLTVTTSAPLALAPTDVFLGTSCSSIASAIVVGGLGPPYFALSSSDYLTVTIGGSIVSIRRAVTTAPLPSPPATSIPVAITDGRSVLTLTAHVPAGPCVP